MKMKTIALALVLAVAPGGAYAKPHRQITDAQREDCLMTDEDPDGTEFCMKSGKGMTQAQKDAWQDKEAKKTTDEVNARAAAGETPNLENCTREITDAKTLGKWWPGIKPNEEDCRPFAAQVQAYANGQQQAAEARLHHAKNSEIMRQCNRMIDTPGVDWREVAALRGVTVSLDDCAKAAAGLAAEFQK